MMIRRKYFIVIYLLLLLLSCKDNPISPEITQYTGITKTAENGTDPIGEIDADDWKILNEINTKVYPAYPNPTNGNSYFQYEISQQDSVVIILDDPIENKRTTLLSRKQLPGRYVLTIDLTYGASTPTRKDGISRLFFNVVRNGKQYSTHGDIEFRWK